MECPIALAAGLCRQRICVQNCFAVYFGTIQECHVTLSNEYFQREYLEAHRRGLQERRMMANLAQSMLSKFVKKLRAYQQCC